MQPRVLVVEDDPDYAVLAGHRLAGMMPEARIDYSTTLLSAGEHLDAAQYQGILLDLLLPDSEDPMNTFFAICEKSAHAPIVVLSANTDPEVIYQLREAGAVDYIEKQGANAAAWVRTVGVFKRQRVGATNGSGDWVHRTLVSVDSMIRKLTHDSILRDKRLDKIEDSIKPLVGAMTGLRRVGLAAVWLGGVLFSVTTALPKVQEFVQWWRSLP